MNIEAKVAVIVGSENEKLSQWFNAEVDKLVAQMDYTNADTTKIVVDYLSARNSLDRLRDEVCRDLPGLHQASQEFPEIADHINAVVMKSVDMACYLLGVVNVAGRIIIKRLNKNGT